MDLITRAVPPDTLEQTMDKARAALRHASSVGVTTLQDMTASAMELQAYQALRGRGELTARIYSIQNHGIEGLTAAGVATGFGDDWIRIGGIKLFADGSMGSGTAAFFEPYTDDPSTTGLLLHTPGDAAAGHLRGRCRRLSSHRARDWRPRECHRPRCAGTAAAGPRRTRSAPADRARTGRPRRRQGQVPRLPASSRRSSRATASTICDGRSGGLDTSGRRSRTTSSRSSTLARALRSGPIGTSSR